MGLSASQARLLTLNNRMSDLSFNAQLITNDKMRLASTSSKIGQNLQAALSDEVFMNTTTNKEVNANMLTGFQTMGENTPQKILKSSNGKIVVSDDTATKFENSDDFESFVNQYGYTSVNPDAPTDPGGGDAPEGPSMPPITQETIDSGTLNITSNIQSWEGKFDNLYEHLIAVTLDEEEYNHQLSSCLAAPHTQQNDDEIDDLRRYIRELAQERLEIEGSFPRIIEGICQGFSNLKSYYQGLNTQCEGNEVNIDSISENFTNFDALIAQLITKMQDFNEAMAVANEAHQTVRERVEEYGIAAYLAYQAYPDDQSYQDEANTAYAAWMAAGTAAMAADGNLDNIKNDFFGIITDGLTPLINNINASFIQATQPKPPTEPPTDPDNTYTYDAGRVFYYSNIFNEMLKGYISVEDEKFNDATWIHDQIKNGNIHMEEYSESANGGQGGFVETSIAQDSSLYEESYEKNNAAAQAEYDRLISDLNYKEKQLDMKLNTINTEYNAAKEEYESVKKTQEKSIDRTFKIFG